MSWGCLVRNDVVGSGGDGGKQRGLRSPHLTPRKGSAFSCSNILGSPGRFIWCFEDRFCCSKKI